VANEVGGAMGRELDEDSRLLLASHDPGAFAMFYRRNRDPLLAWIYRKTFDAEVAADLGAEVFARVIEKRSEFDVTRGPARAWLWGVAAYEVRRWAREGATAERARRRVGVPVLHVDEDAIAYIESLVDLRPTLPHLRSHFMALPTGERRALELRIVQELPYEEVAVRLGCTRGAARVRVSRGLARLRRLLDEAGVPTRPAGAAE
jgi:RNA polymerase sigma-70 factor (ECF subfamily)